MLVVGANACAGQAAALPVQRSATSQTAPTARHTVEDEANDSPGHAVLVPLQVSAVSHTPVTDRQRLPALPAGCVQLPEPLQRSSVHGFESLVHAVPAAFAQLLALSLQELLHSLPP